MNRRLLFLFAGLTLFVGGNVGTSVAENPKPKDLEDHDWFALRDIDDPGLVGETAAYLKVTKANASKIEGELWVYKKHDSEDKYVWKSPTPTILKGDWDKSNKKRRTAILKAGTVKVAAITYWMDNSNKGPTTKQLRVVLRFLSAFPGYVHKKVDEDPCELPPDDDILEEEPPLAMGTPPDDSWLEDEDPYPPGP